MIDFNRYFDKNAKKISISNALDMLFSPFDSDSVAQKTFEKHFNNPESEYYQMSKEQILKAWSDKGAESCRYGSLLDDYIGAVLTGTENDIKLFKLDNGYDYDTRLHGLCDSFDSFYEILSKSGDTEFIAREKYVYLPINIDGEENYIYGRFDALFRNKRTNKYIVIDWKSSGTIDKISTKWTKKMLGPMYKYPQLNWYRYTLQLYFYKQALIENGYVPKDTNPDDIVVMIVNLPGKIIPECNQNYQIHQGAIPYDPDLLKSFYKFAIQKFNLMKNENKKDEDGVVTNENKETDNNNLENIF